MANRQFQHTAARRRLPGLGATRTIEGSVSTHSRTKAAASIYPFTGSANRVSTHSRTKAAALKNRPKAVYYDVSTHSRTKAAALRVVYFE